MYSNMKYYENICNCLRVIQQDVNRKLKSANCWQGTSLRDRFEVVCGVLWVVLRWFGCVFLGGGCLGCLYGPAMGVV